METKSNDERNKANCSPLYHIKLGKNYTASGLIAFDGKKILINTHYKYHLIDLNLPDTIDFDERDSMFDANDRFNLHESTENSTAIIPTTIYSKHNKRFSDKESHIFEIDGNGKCISKKIYEGSSIKLEKYDVDKLQNILTQYSGGKFHICMGIDVTRILLYQNRLFFNSFEKD